jgi:hypothetical protein
MYYINVWSGEAEKYIIIVSLCLPQSADLDSESCRQLRGQARTTVVAELDGAG